MLRIVNPATTSNAKDTTISPVTSTRLMRPMRRLPDLAPSLSNSFTSPRDARHAGNAPDKTAVTAVRPAAKASAARSICTFIQNGGFVSAIAWLNCQIPTCANSRPMAVPPTARTDDSASS
jgi:hypothetical protein